MDNALEKHQFDDHSKILEAHERRLDSHDKELENRVTYKHFYWITGILITIVGSMFLMIWQSLQYVEKITATTQSSVSFIQGTLQNASITK